MKKILLIIVAILLSNTSFAQISDSNSNIRETKPLGVSIEFGGVLYTSVVVDYFVTPKINIEFNGIFIKIEEHYGIGTGVKYHPWGDEANRKWSPYIGAKAGYIKVFFVNQMEYVNFHTPLGINYISPKGFDFSADLGWFHERNQGNFESNINNYVMASLKLGYRF